MPLRDDNLRRATTIQVAVEVAAGDHQAEMSTHDQTTQTSGLHEAVCRYRR
jgi:hypothetical protein